MTNGLDRQRRLRIRELEDRHGQLAGAKVQLADEKLSHKLSEAHMAEAQRLGHIGSWYSNIDTGEHFWSQEAFAILDFDPEEVTASYAMLLERVHPEDRGRVDEIRSAAVQDKRDFEIEFRLLLPGGAIRFVHGIGHCATNDSGQVEVVGAIRDVTDSKRAQEELRRREAFLSEGQHLSRTGSFHWRAGNDEITCSEEFYRIYEFEIGAPMTLQLMRTRVHPDDLTALVELADQTRDRMDDFDWQYRLVMPAGSTKYLHEVAHATRGDDGQLEYIASVQDVTARRVADEALAEAMSELA